MSNLTIALDVMGGDHGPSIIIPAAIQAANKHSNIKLLLCGDRDSINVYLSQQSDYAGDRIEVIHCEQVIAMDDKPSQVVRSKRDSSMGKAIQLVEQGKADACVSAGNTGALMAMSYYLLGTLPGIDRPALVSTVPTVLHEKVWLLDLGANISVTSDVLLQFAIMGSVLAESVDNHQTPRVALLNVGEESIKGNDQVKQADKLLSASEQINYIGYVEGNDIFSNKADVIVTDGFVGNIALKSCEGFAKLVITEVKRLSQKNLFTRLMAKAALPLLKRIYVRMNPDQYNGASLIGLRGIVVKSHGNASSDAFVYAIEEAMQEVTRQVPTRIRDKIEAVMG